MKKLSIILFLFAIEKCSTKCPDGTVAITPHKDGSTLQRQFCDADKVHFAGVGCCDDNSFKLCTTTGMRSAFVFTLNYITSPLIGPFYATNKKETHFSAYVYDVTYTERAFVCPYPIGYLWFNKYDTFDGFPPPEMLPADPIDSSSQLAACDSNKECSFNEFCGHVINRSFDAKFAKCADTGTLCTRHDQCNHGECGVLDDTYPYADLEKKFCYKIPDVHAPLSAIAQYIAKPNEIGLRMCNTNTDCGSGEKCHITSKEKWATYDPTNAVRVLHRGMCIKPLPFSHTHSFNYLKVHAFDRSSHTELAATVFLPVDMENKRRDDLIACQKNSDCVDKLQFCGYAYSFPDDGPSSDKYCYEVFGEHQNLLVNPDEIDLVVCDTDQDCGGKLCSIIPNRKYPSMGKTKMARGLCTTQDVVKKIKNNNNMIIIIVLAIALVVALLVALVGGSVLFKKLSKNGGKKDKKGKTGKNKTTTSTTTKSVTKVGKSGMGTTI